MEADEKRKWLEAGKIGKAARELGVSLAKPGTPLIELARAIEKKITELGGKTAFPPNLSLNQIAAHYTPKFNDTMVLKEGDLLKVDVGASIDGFLSDTAATVVVGGGESKLVTAARDALDNAINALKSDLNTRAISEAVEKTIRAAGFSPIVNLGGHGIARYSIHEGNFISNVQTGTGRKIEEGVIAIEPFATTGGGYVIDSEEVQILMMLEKHQTRSALGRKILDFINSEYNGLPFAKRWILEKFGGIAELEIKQLISAGALHEFNVLKEQDNGLVAQFEHTILITGDEIIVTTI